MRITRINMEVNQRLPLFNVDKKTKKKKKKKTKRLIDQHQLIKENNKINLLRGYPDLKVVSNQYFATFLPTSEYYIYCSVILCQNTYRSIVLRTIILN